MSIVQGTAAAMLVLAAAACHAARRSLFCALHQASVDVTGEYDHRRPAMQEVRFALEDATGGRAFEHAGG